MNKCHVLKKIIMLLFWILKKDGNNKEDNGNKVKTKIERNIKT